MLEDQVAYLLQRYLGNYVRGLNTEALKISVWQGDVELRNMQLKPEALNALKLPVKVKAGFLGSVKLKVPWSRLGQDPVLVYLDRIFLLAEPATQVQGFSEDSVQEAKKNRIQEMEMRLWEKSQKLKSEMNKSWLGSLISTIIGNLKLSISNIHIRYEDLESNPGHPFAAGVMLEKLSAMTVDDTGKETFISGGALDRIQKSVELDQLAFYLDSDIVPWQINKPWEDLLPSEWFQVFRFGTKDGKPAESLREHSYILQPVTGEAKYSKLQPNGPADSNQPLHKAVVNLDDVTICLAKDGYRDILKLADNFAAFNQRLKYAHHRPLVPVKSDPRSWWKYACKAVSDQMKKASGKMSWEQVLKYATLQKRYISLYASLLKSDPSQVTISDNKDIQELDRQLDIALILQWRMLAHKFVEQSADLDLKLKKQKERKSWWSFGWTNQSRKEETEQFHFSEEDWNRLNKIIGYKEGDEGQLVIGSKMDALHTSLEIHMNHNASKLVGKAQESVAALSCEDLHCSIKLYPETKVFDMKLGSYQLSSPKGLLAESATSHNSLVGVFCYKPFDEKVDWSMVAKASPCYMTYLKDSIDEIVKFFESDTVVSQTIALETAAAVQMTIDEVKRTAQQQMHRALKDHAWFSLDLDIAAPKITIPTEFCPDNTHATKLLLDLGNLLIHTQDQHERVSAEEDMYLQFDLVLSDVSAFLFDGDYHWSEIDLNKSAHSFTNSFLPIIDKCGVILQLQQIRVETPCYPPTRLSIQLPSLGFHFSPARYHRLMQVIKIFEVEDGETSDFLRPWNQADLEGWLSLLTWKGVGSREAVWQRRYVCLVGPFLYLLESPGSRSYKQCISLRGKQILQVPPEFVGNAEHVLAVSGPTRSNNKVVEDTTSLILRCESEGLRKTWQSRLQGAIYYASDSAPITGLSETSSDHDDNGLELDDQGVVDISMAEKLFVTGVLDELKVSFSYSYQLDQSLMKVLLTEEKRLFEIRAIGGQVELLIRESNIFIGTILKSLEIEDLVCRSQMSKPCYLARSFIGTADAPPSFDDNMRQGVEVGDLTPTEPDDKFYEAPETLVDGGDYSMRSPGGRVECHSSSQIEIQSSHSSLEPPKFNRIAGLLPTTSVEEIELVDSLESFVKAQIIIYDQNSPHYNSIDKQVIVTLSSLSFFVRRPTIVAIMEFMNSINIEDGSPKAFTDGSLTASLGHDVITDGDNLHSKSIEEPAVKGLLGKGKSRVMFNLTLKMAQAQILLMNENETKLASLSQENLLTDIKVFPSSFSIKAALGNLRISDDSLAISHLYYWACDMRNPGGRSFVELMFTSFCANDEDYEGYDYSLFGQLSEVRIVYLNRFVQEIVGYFTGLVPNTPKRVVKLTDQVTNSEKWFSAGEIEGSPAVKLDLSLRKPIILMPRRTDSLDFLRLDIVHITVKNAFQWIGGSKDKMNAVHLETMLVQVEDINLNVGTGSELGETIVQDVNGLSVTIHRSLRDLLCQLPRTEAVIKIQELKAALSNKEYQIISECAVSNFSEAPHLPPPLNQHSSMSSNDSAGEIILQDANDVDLRASRATNAKTSILLKVCVSLDLVELSLYTGVSRDASLATIQVSVAWLLYKSSISGEAFLSATLQGFSVFDDRAGVEQEFRLAIGKPVINTLVCNQNQHTVASNIIKGKNSEPLPTMLVVDVKFSQISTSVSLCIQRPQLLVALDFLLAVVEFFVPTVSSMLSNEEDRSSDVMDAIFLGHSVYRQPCANFSLSPQKPLIFDDENFDHFIYDGGGGTLYLKDRRGFNLTAPSTEVIIYVGSGKKLQFKNVVVKNGQHLDSCVSLGANSSYSALKDDCVYLEGIDESPQSRFLNGSIDEDPCQNNVDNNENAAEFIIELQAVGPELTFYNTSKDVGDFLNLSNKLLHARLDVFCRLLLKGNNTEISADAVGLTMESNGIRILEPFDTFMKYSNASGKTNIHLSVSDIFMNFTFSILRLFLAVEDDMLAFLRMTSKKMTTICFHFDKVGTINDPHTDQTYAFWRPHAPPGFAVLGDYLTPLDKPPTKGVLAVNTNSIRVKKPVNFRLIWPPSGRGGLMGQEVDNPELLANGALERDGFCSIWFPEAPKGYVALGCVVTQEKSPPPLSSSFCIPSSSVSPCSLQDCVTINFTDISSSSIAFWRVDNSVGTFLPADPATLILMGKAYELRHVKYNFLKASPAGSSSPDVQAPSGRKHSVQPEQSADANSNRRFEPVASFHLIWWNQGSNSSKRLSIWRPVVSEGMVYFGDVAVKGYEPPNACIVLRDSRDENLFKAPLDFQLVGQIKKQRGMDSISFWLPQAPPGFVSFGCVASKGKPKESEFSTLRCMRNDMVTGDQFLEESVWDTYDARHVREPFSIWAVDNELGTFIVRGGFKRPPRRFALKLADSNIPSGSDVTVVDARVGTFSAALFDDYGGLMVPLFNISLSGIAFRLHGRTEYLNCTISFAFAARSYNDKCETWEPLVEPVNGFLRYQYDLNAPGAASQLRLTSTKDLNLNVSVSNANMVIQAYASWNNLSSTHEHYKNRDAFSPSYGESSIIDTLHKRSYYIIPQNKLGQDIFIRATEVRGLQNFIRMPSGDMKPVKVPVSKNMLDSHLNGRLCRKIRTMVTIIILDAQFPRVEGPASHQYTVAICLTPTQGLPTEALVHQQSVRTCGSSPYQSLPSDIELVKWNEVFFFRVDSLDYYLLELIVTDMSKGDPVGFFSAPLNRIATAVENCSERFDFANQLKWIDLSAKNSMEDDSKQSCGKLRCAILVHDSEVESDGQSSVDNGQRSGFIQISPGKEGPWTTVRLNYAAPAACWRLGNDVVASEVSVKDGNRYVNIRSLVSVRNCTDFVLQLCLTSKISQGKISVLSDDSDSIQVDSNRVKTDEFFETQKYNPLSGWFSVHPGQDISEGGKSHQASLVDDLPSGWEWIDDWHLDSTSTNTADGWVYAPGIENLRWPETFDPKESVNSTRQRRWLRSRKLISSDPKQEISVGLLQPGETVPLPLSALTQSGQYFLQLRPWNSSNPSEYSWSSVVDRPSQAEDSGRPKQYSEIYVSSLSESEELFCCTEMIGTSGRSQKLWFCVSIQATEIAKDVRSDPIQDWCLVVKSPLVISNLLPLAAEYSVLEMQSSGHFVACSRGIFLSGKDVQIYSADIRKPLFLSLLPQRGWLPIREAVLISHPRGIPSKTISLRSSISGRVVQIILEQNYDKEQPLLAKTVRVYAPYWFGVARCPPLTYRILDMGGKRRKSKIGARFQTNKNGGSAMEEITDEEIYEGYTIASALNFNTLALSVAIAQSGSEHFGPAKDLSPLGDMDGSLDVFAFDADGNCLRLFISTKPCPHPSVPTKVISVRPFMTFTNRLGQDIFIKLSTEDEPKVLHASDSRISFMYRGTGEPEKLQVRLEDTVWSFPLQVIREDTISLVLRRQDGTLKFLRIEIRGYEEGSRYIVVFRLGLIDGPIRIENRTDSKTLSIRQSGFGEDAWIQLQPLSTTNFSWEDPYGQKFLDAKISADHSARIWKLDLGRTGLCSAESELQFYVVEERGITIVKFKDDEILNSSSYEEIRCASLSGNEVISGVGMEMKTSSTPFELLIELGMVGISMVDHRPKELCFLYLERVFLSYSTGYDGGKTSRFKLIFGYLQLDNQLPLTLMPVLLAPEQDSDVQHPVFKMTITMQNENKDGIQVYPYVYIRVTEKCWRLDIHEPIIWAIVDFYNNLQLDRIPKSSTVTEVDPEIRFDLIDVSEVRLKLSLETAPGQRPHGILGIWSPILSAVGNAFKIQVHLRRVMHRDRFMRKSSIVPAIGNRIWRDLIHNPLHLIFSVDVLGMTSSTLSSLSGGFAELSTDGQFLQLRAKQVRSRRITGFGDGIIQGTEALAQGVAFGVSGVVRKPVESARQNGLLGLAHGLGRAFLGFIVQPVSGALDFFSLTVDGIGASCSKCFEVFNSKTTSQRIRNPRAIHADGILREYCEREAIGQMVLYLGEASRHFGCTRMFKEPSKFALSDSYEEHFRVPHQRVVLITNKRVMLLQGLDPDKMDKKPCKIMWDVPWDELMAVELAKAGSNQPSHLILHLKHFQRSESFVRVIKCSTVEESGGREPQTVTICSVVHRIWKAYQSDMKSLVLKVPSSQRHVYFAWGEADGRELRTPNKAIISARELSSHSTATDDRRFITHSITFSKIWSSEQEYKGRCSLCRKQISQDGGLCSIWRPICPDGYTSIGDIAHVGIHPPNVAAVYRKMDEYFRLPVGYDLVWRNCMDDYVTPVSIWHPRAPDGYVSPGCVAVAGFMEPEPDLVYCIAESLVEETQFEEQKVWSAPDSYPWACHIYQVQSDALHFVALRQTKEESHWKPTRLIDDLHTRLQSS